jgi:uncharacterized membrane protein
MHIHPIAFFIPAAALGTALAFGLVSYARRGDNPRRRLRIVQYAVVLESAVFVTVDFFTTPAYRWFYGAILALMALLMTGAFGYEWFRRSKARSER